MNLLKKWKKIDGISQLENSIKSANVCTSQLFLEHIDSFKEVKEQLFQFYNQDRVVRLNFDSYIFRSKCIDEHVNRIFFSDKVEKGKERPLAVGDAAFSSTYKSHMPVPKHKFIQRLSQRAAVVKVNEYNTSRVCHRCGIITKSMYKTEDIFCGHNKPKKYRLEKDKQKRMETGISQRWAKKDQIVCNEQIEKWKRKILLKKLRWIKDNPFDDEWNSFNVQQLTELHEKLKPSRKLSVRGIKQCSNIGGCMLTLNRDTNAAINILHVLKHWIKYKERPPALTKENKLFLD